MREKTMRKLKEIPCRQGVPDYGLIPLRAASIAHAL